MKRSLAYVARRLLGSVLAAYVVVTLVFLFVSLTPDPNLDALIHAQTFGQPGNTTAAVQEIKRTYAETRGLDRPLHVRYLDWLWKISTLQWGQSYTLEAPVLPVILDAGRKTLNYVVPAIVVSTTLSTLVALFSGATENSVFDRVTSTLGYAGYGMPNFVLGTVLFVVFLTGTSVIGTATTTLQYALAAAVLTTTLLASQIHYFRAEIHEHLNEKFVTVLRAKGVSRFRLAKHVLRNATLPLLSLLFSDLVAVLMLHVFIIEAVFGIPGIGDLTLLAVRERDMPLILGVTMFVVFVGILGHLLEDLAALRLDPRTRTDD